MAVKHTGTRRRAELPEVARITGITVSGFKSIRRESRIEIRPLTILAGANSAGKSSIMQPLLILKQTLEASYDPGPLMLDGPNARFASGSELFSHGGPPHFSIKVTVSEASVESRFGWRERDGVTLNETVYRNGNQIDSYTPGMTHDEIVSTAPLEFQQMLTRTGGLLDDYEFGVVRVRCFLVPRLISRERMIAGEFGGLLELPAIDQLIRETLHVPGLRGNPQRTYPVTAVSQVFPGTFENYVASVIVQWQSEDNLAKMEGLAANLRALDLTWKIEATRLADTQVKLQVGRLLQPGSRGRPDMVNIADVGFGVSQTLPVLVALQAAGKGQMVYIEQPEIHLHPRAQRMMAGVLAEAARRDVCVVAETHSTILLRAIQTLVAQGDLSPELVKLHWFTRDKYGTTSVSSADLDKDGAFGDWPEDFDDVILESESAYLDAVEAREVAR